MAFNSARKCAALCEKAAAKIVGFLQFVEKSRCLAFDVLGEAKRVTALEQPDGSNLSCPFVHILKKMMMDRLVVREIEHPFR